MHWIIFITIFSKLLYILRLSSYYRKFVFNPQEENGDIVRVNNVTHVLFYMDDIIIFSGSVKRLERAVKDFKRYITDVLFLTIKRTMVYSEQGRLKLI